jgi:hypothetical protein
MTKPTLKKLSDDTYRAHLVETMRASAARLMGRDKEITSQEIRIEVPG